MQFIRENIFFTVLAGIFLLCLCLFIPIKMSLSGTYEERVALRQQIIDQCKKNNRPTYVDKTSVEQGEKDRNAIRDQAVLVAETVRNHNCAQYKPLMIEDTKGLLVPSFPIDREMYQSQSLGFAYTLRYRSWIEDKLKELNPAAVPTEAEIKKEIERQKARLEAEAEILRKKEKKEAAKAGTDETTRTDPRSPAIPMDDFSRTGTGTGVEDEKNPDYIGTMWAKIAAAEKGAMYVDTNSIDFVFPKEGVSSPAYTDLWYAEISRWVFMDIIEAVKETNKQSLVAGSTIKSPTVVNSGIKRLVSMSVDRGYITDPKRATSGSSRGAGPDGMPPIAMPGAPSTITTNTQYTYQGLTGRYCSELFDVVHYRFTVVMSVSHLQTLQKLLMKQNLHTVLGVRVIDVPKEEKDKDLYYYGRDPVMQVTIHGELLLLTDWTRGTWDKTEWSKEFPPLVPEAVLELSTMDYALRPRDKDRVREYKNKIGIR